MKFIKKLNISEKIFAILMFLVLIVLLLPIVRLAFYTTPYYDDFNYSQYLVYRWNQAPRFLNIFNAGIDGARNTWNYWQGTYSSVFFMCINPFPIRYDLYFWGVLGIIASLVLGTFILVCTLGKYFLKTGFYGKVLLASLITITLVELCYSAQQGIFWYNAGVHYTFMNGLMFLLIASLLGLVFGKKKFLVLKEIGCAVLAFIVAGANFVTALQGFLLIILLVLMMLIYRKKECMRLLGPIVVYLAGLVLNIVAPGNAVREAYYVDSAMGPVESILRSLGSGVTMFPELTKPVTFIILIMAFPILWNMCRSVSFDFKYPWLVSILSFGIYAAGFTPSYYGMGYAGLARSFCTIKYTLELLLFINEAYWIGWAQNRRAVKEKENRELGYNVPLYLVCIIAVAVCFVFSKDQAGNFMSYGSYYYVHTGEANNYYQEQMAIVEEIKNGPATVELEPIVWKPWFLFKKNQFETYPEAEQNVAMSRFFGKDAIYVRSDE